MSHVTKQIKLPVPVSAAYNRWTQFESFPSFMEGVEEVRQLDDKRLHWKAEVAGKTVEWDDGRHAEEGGKGDQDPADDVRQHGVSAASGQMGRSTPARRRPC